MATIYDVAALAGVSPATVSRVFNGASVSPAKTQQVRTAAEQLQFTPNRTARNLRRRHAEVIALIIPDIENPYFTEMARGVEDVAQESGYSVVLCNTDGRLDKEMSYLQVAIGENMAGVIVAPASPQSDLGPVLDQGRAVVAVDRALRDIDAVMAPNRVAGESATAELYRAGYRRIACITGPEEIETARERASGWSQVVRAHSGTEPDPAYLTYSTFHVDGGRESAERMLASSEPPDAFVAGNNLLGVGVLQALAENGLAPPRIGVAVVGSLPFTTLAPLAVTVVRLPARQMGVTAAQMLLDRIAGDDQPTRTVVLDSEVQAANLAGP